MSRIVVVGAGVGGLACAIRLGAAGHSVTVFEQADRPGGKLARLTRRTPAGDFTFDTGPNLLTLPHVFGDLFAAAGSTMDSYLDLVRLDPVMRHVFADNTVLDSCSDPHEFAGRIRTTFDANAAADWLRLWARAERVWDTSWRHVINSTMDSPLKVARLAWRLPDLTAVAPGRTLRGLARSYLSEPNLRQLLERYATYTGSDPRRAPAALVAIPYAELHYGGWYVRGGLARIADALAHLCQSIGVRLVLGAPVAEVATRSDRVSGVRLADGSLATADAVVVNADAAALYRDLLPDPTRLWRLRHRSLGGFVLLLGVKGSTPGLAHHTVLFPADYDAEFDAIFGAAPRPVADPTIAITVADDTLVRPQGYEAWFVLVNAAPQGAVDWRAPGVAQSYADHILAQLAGRGLDVRDRLMFREVLTPADLEDATWTPGGAIYGTPSHGTGGLFRPPNRGPVRGLYLVGGSTHPGGGLPMVAVSGDLVARRLSGQRLRSDGPRAQ